jgi:hypothetical protein
MGSDEELVSGEFLTGFFGFFIQVTFTGPG